MASTVQDESLFEASTHQLGQVLQVNMMIVNSEAIRKAEVPVAARTIGRQGHILPHLGVIRASIGYTGRVDSKHNAAHANAGQCANIQ